MMEESPSRLPLLSRSSLGTTSSNRHSAKCFMQKVLAMLVSPLHGALELAQKSSLSGEVEATISVAIRTDGASGSCRSLLQISAICPHPGSCTLPDRKPILANHRQSAVATELINCHCVVHCNCVGFFVRLSFQAVRAATVAPQSLRVMACQNTGI
jgi:hypothetical protein